MATYRITGPDGKKYKIEGPAGASDEELLAAINAQPSTEPDKKRTLMSALGEAAGNLPSSLYGLIEPIVERPGETAKAVGGLLTDVALSPTITPAIERTIRGTGESIKERYGSGQRALRTLAEDPAGLLADVSLVAGGAGGALRQVPRTNVVGRAAGRAGDIAAKASEVLDPFSAAASAISGAGKGVAGALGVTSGTGGRAVQEAFAAGARGGKAREAFTTQMRGGEEVLTDILPPAKQALDTMRAERSTAYRSGMVDIKNDKAILDFNQIDNTLADIKDRGFYKGKQFQKSAADTWTKIDELVSDWKQSNPQEFHTPEGLDALKKGIGDIRDSLPFGSPARNVANNAYNSVREQITRQAPSYAKVMKDYEEASSLINEVESALSMGKKATAEQSLRKLQSIMRNNVQTSYGRRTQLGEELAKRGATELFPQLAGQMMSSVTPRGLVGQGTAVGTGIPALMTGNLATLPLIAATSPRVVGEAALAAGRVAGLPSRIAGQSRQLASQISKYGDKLAARDPRMAMAVDIARRSAQTGANIDPLMARMLSYQLARIEQEEE